MTTAALSPLQKQGDVSKDPTAPTAVLPQGSSPPPTATTSHEQGPKTSPTATTACTWGSGSSLLDTLAHCYTPHCTPVPSPYVYKRKVQGSRTRRWSRGRTSQHIRLSLSLSPTRTLVTPYYKRIHPGCRTTQGRGFPLLFSPLCPVSRRPILARTRNDNLLVDLGTPGVETPTVGAPGRGLLRVDEQLPVKLQMGSLQQPLQPGTVLRFGSLEFMSLDGSYDMILLPPPRDNDNGGRQPARRRWNRRRLPHVAEEQHPGLSRHLPCRRRRRRGRHGQAGGSTSSAVERVDGAVALAGDTSGVDLASETKTSVVSPQHANPMLTDDTSTLAKDLLGISFVPQTTVQSAPDATLSPPVDQEVPSVSHPMPFTFSRDPPSDPASVDAFIKACPNPLGYHMRSI
jgi:hypothetical protein